MQAYQVNTGWTNLTLSGSWTNTAFAGFATAAKIRRLNNFQSEISGLVANNTAVSTNSVICNIPAAFRPNVRTIVYTLGSFGGGGDTGVRLDLTTSGDLLYISTAPTITFTSVFYLHLNFIYPLAV